MLNILAAAVDYSYNVTTTSSGTSSVAGILIMLLYLVVLVVAIAAMWKIFVKAGEEGWKSLIPIYNTWVLIEISGKPGWWLLLMLIPFVNFVVWIIVALELAKRFGKSTAFAIFGLIIFSLVGYLMLGFGDAKYDGKKYQAVAAN
ncbi:MAG: DUF5684 domain-containing protein [Candidatus Saccharibacteria bacterium]